VRDPRGSFWRKWDLHIHTPASLVHNYPGQGDAAWDAFLADLEGLPPEFKVIGVNDYIFLDGYRRLVKAKASGRLPNLNLILPVVELRIDKFGGTAGALSRLNFHVIFSNEVDAGLIEAQFINALVAQYKIDPDHADAAGDWKAIPTRESLADLGNKIIASAPSSEKGKYGPALLEGFNALNFPIGTVRDALDKPCFRDKYLTAVGKTEWADIKWTGSVAEKKSLVNGCDFLLSANDTPGDFTKALESLQKAQVNARLLHCSDAHDLSSSTAKDRIGHSFCWIKADTTFDGLRLAKCEYPERVFVGDRPPKLHHLQSNPSKYVKSVSVAKKPGSALPEKWFDCSVPLNPGLVAIIGNKGSGKSALADVLGFLGETPHSAFFSFLTPRRFLDPKTDYATHFAGTIEWHSGVKTAKELSDTWDGTRNESVKYLPQAYLEAVCNEHPGAAEGLFDRELKSVIFSHVPEHERLGKESLDELASFLTEERDKEVATLRKSLSELNGAIVKLEELHTEKARRTLENELQAKTAELNAHDNARVLPLTAPSIDPSAQTEASTLSTQLTAVEAAIGTLSEREASIRSQLATQSLRSQIAARVLKRIAAVEAQVGQAASEIAGDLAEIGLAGASVLTLSVDRSSVEDVISQTDSQLTQLNAQLDETQSGSVAFELKRHRAEADNIRARLDEPNRLYRANLEQIRGWEIRRAEIVGSAERIGSLEHVRRRISELDHVPARLAALHSARRQKVTEIHASLRSIAEAYRRLYRPVQDFISTHKLSKAQFSLMFDVSIINTGFEERFFEMVSRAASGFFRGVEEGEKALRSLIAQHDLNTGEQVVALTEAVIRVLNGTNSLDDQGAIERIGAQLRGRRSMNDLYDFVYGLEYLSPRYNLKLGSRELGQLSPGEKGALLLVFYLLVDKGDIPLVVDQPEENLDNQTVYDLLVPCIREAKKRRQVLMVTHNPNLAVVCDAEQIVYASIDRSGGNAISYETGGLESPALRLRVIDVLEGTKPAFQNREIKYLI
jgi:ABC-type lipoprotein export system ATPase subunit